MCQDFRVNSLRTYGGITGDDRRAERRDQLVEAARTLLAGDGPGTALSVRGVCREAALATRYFYESFDDLDALIGTVYDEAVDAIADRTLAAVSSGSTDATAVVRSGLDAVVRQVAEDRAAARLLFSPALASLPVVAERRSTSARLFVGLLDLEARAFYAEEYEESPRTWVAAQMLVGGLGQILSAWLDDGLDLTTDELVEHCAEMFLAIGDLVRGDT